MGKLFIPFTKWPLSLGKSALSTALSKTILNASTQYALNPTTSVELEGLTVEATGKKTPAELSAILAGGIFTSSVIWGYKKVKYRKRQQVFQVLEKAIKLKQASFTQSGEEFAKLMAKQSQGATSGFTEADIALNLISLNNAKEDAQIIEELLIMGSETQDLSKSSLFNKRVKSGEFMTPTIIEALDNIPDFDRIKYEKALKEIVDANLFFSNKTTKAELELFSLVFETDDLLGFRQALKEQISSIDKFLKGADAASIYEQSTLPKYDGEDLTDEGKYLNKQAKDAEKTLANLNEVNDALNNSIDDFIRQQGKDPDTGKFLSKKAMARATATGLGKALGYALWVDGIIWVGTVAIDLGLNLFMDEDEQGFFSERAGFSFVDEFVVVPLLDWIFGDEEVQEFLVETLLEIAESSDSLTGVIYGVLFWFVESFDAQVDLNVDNDTTGQFILDSFSESYQPEYILVAGFCAIVALEVWNSLLMPSWAILTGSDPSI